MFRIFFPLIIIVLNSNQADTLQYDENSSNQNIVQTSSNIRIMEINLGILSRIRFAHKALEKMNYIFRPYKINTKYNLDFNVVERNFYRNDNLEILNLKRVFCSNTSFANSAPIYYYLT